MDLGGAVRRVWVLLVAVGLVVAVAAPAGALPRPQPTQSFIPMCHVELDVPSNGFTTIWSDLFVDCVENVTVIIRVEIWSSYLLPGGAGERFRKGEIDSGLGWNHHFRVTMPCKWTASRVGGFYFARATVWAISENDHSQQSVGSLRTPAWPLPCVDTSIPGGL